MGTDPDRSRARRKRQGELIRRLRAMHDLSIQDLAETLEVTPGAVSQWENGRFTPRLAIQVRIANALKVPHSAIFGVDQDVA